MSRPKRKGVSLRKQTQWVFVLAPSLNFLPLTVRDVMSANVSAAPFGSTVWLCHYSH